MIPALDRLSLKLVIAVSLALMVALLVSDRNRWKAKTAHYSGLLASERSAHAATVANYRAAAERARREDAANAARVKAAQDAINERTVSEFETRIAAARASARRMRADDPASRRTGGSSATPLPGLPAPAGGVAQAASEDGLSRSDRLTATEQAIQLDELIKWVRRQSAVDPNEPR
ncbi:MAG: hypothetical protein ACLGHC_06050 [Alphaproteobacteria bacterium]